MTSWTSGLNQVATYWAPSGNDGYGGKSLSAPVLINCRWQNTSVLFRDAAGREFMSQAVVYPDRELEVRGLVALGDHTGAVLAGEDGDEDTRPSAQALEIRQSGASPALHSDLILYKVVL